MMMRMIVWCRGVICQRMSRLIIAGIRMYMDERGRMNG